MRGAPLRRGGCGVMALAILNRRGVVQDGIGKVRFRRKGG